MMSLWCRHDIAGYVTLFQSSTDDTARGRAFSLIAVVRTLAVVTGTSIAGVLGERVGIIAVLAYQGVGYVLAGGVVLLVLGRPQAVTSSSSSST